MTTRVITNEAELQGLVRLLGGRKLPITVNIKQGKHRTNNQNSLQRKWMTEAEEQLGEYTSEEYRGYCKLHFGVPILRNSDDNFCAEYDQVIKPLAYEHKLRLMQVPFDFRVTSLLTTKQKTQYLDAVRAHFEGIGVHLTIPEDRG